MNETINAVIDHPKIAYNQADHIVGWMAADYEFVNADLLFYDKTLAFITEHRNASPEKPFFVVFSTQISHAPVLPAPAVIRITA